MGLIVAKFGGSSVATPQMIQAVAERLIALKDEGHDVVAVVSAMGDSTDDLLALAAQVDPHPTDHELDMLVTTGEQVSMSLLAMALHARGVESVSFTGGQAGIHTDGVFGKSKITDVRPERIRQALDDGKVVIVAGFQGVTATGEVSSLGRGGSDTTAVALAAALDADVCRINTDVDGVYTADPRICPDARKIDRMSYEEMLEFAGAGAGVLQMRSVEFARNYKVRLECRSSFGDDQGTIIEEEDPDMEAAIISGIAHDTSEAKITIRHVPDRPGIAATIFTAMAEANVNVDMIIQNVAEDGYTDMSFTSPRTDLDRARETCERIVPALGAVEYLIDEDVAKVSLVGAGMRSNPGVAAKMFKVLADVGVNITMISTSPIRISTVIDGEHVEKAVNALHQGFGLSEAAVNEEFIPSGTELQA